MEEAGKSEVSFFTKAVTDGQRLRNDLLRDHKKKQTIAAMPTVAMGSRLIESLGGARVEKLFEMVYG